MSTNIQVILTFCIFAEEKLIMAKKKVERFEKETIREIRGNTDLMNRLAEYFQTTHWAVYMLLYRNSSPMLHELPVLKMIADALNVNIESLIKKQSNV